MDKETSISKKCEICGKIKYIGEFSKSYRNRCKQCVAEQTRSIRALNKSAKSVGLGFTHEVDTIDKQFAIEVINTSVNILTNEILSMFSNVPGRDVFTSQIVNNYHKEITEWLNDKTK